MNFNQPICDRDWDLSDRVLSKLPRSEREVLDRAVTRAADAADMFVSDGIHRAMNQFNASGGPPDEEESR